MFTLCPWGDNPESFRMYEAIEAGSIPIFIRCDENRSPMTLMGSENPIPQFDNWDEAFDFIERMKNRLDDVNELQNRILLFYQDYKEMVQLKIKSIIDDSFQKSYGYAC